MIVLSRFVRIAVLAFGNLSICTDAVSLKLTFSREESPYPLQDLKKAQQCVPRKVQMKIKPENWRQMWKVRVVYSNLETVAILLTF